MAETLSLEVDLAPGSKRGLVLPNPVMVASGTFGYGTEFKAFDVQRRVNRLHVEESARVLGVQDRPLEVIERIGEAGDPALVALLQRERPREERLDRGLRLRWRRLGRRQRAEQAVAR